MVFGDGNKSSKGKCSCSPHLSLYHQPRVGNSVLLWDVGAQVFWAVSISTVNGGQGNDNKEDIK